MKKGRGRSECCRIAELPEEVLIDILSRLSIKSISTCRCVSKTWHNLLSSSNTHFTKLHFNRSPVQFIYERGIDNNRKVLRHLVELQDNTDLDSVKLFPSKFRLSSYVLCAVNSCNGFLCLATYIYHGNPVKVCNPITGEYLNLPKHKMDGYIDVTSGFGCSSNTNQYKVVKLMFRGEFDAVLRNSYQEEMAVVYTIGTKSWRNIGTAPKLSNQLHGATFFNGAIHWFCYNNFSSDFIISFDLETEKFGVVPPPSHFSIHTITKRHNMKIGVLGDFLYLSYSRELWVMKEYGVQESWAKMYVVDRMPENTYQPIKYLSGGKILMNDTNYVKLISYDPMENICKELQHPQFHWRFRIIAHVPSFMSFNDAMMRDKGAKLRTRLERIEPYNNQIICIGGTAISDHRHLFFIREERWQDHIVQKYYIYPGH